MSSTKIKITIKINKPSDKPPNKQPDIPLNKPPIKYRSPFSPREKSGVVSVKTSLKSILKNYGRNFPIINRLVIDSHEIVTRTYQFIRLYLLAEYEKIKIASFINQSEPPKTLFPILKKKENNVIIESSEIDKDLILYFLRAGGISDPRGTKVSNPEIKESLEKFYDTEFLPCLNKEKYDLKNKSYLIPYLAQQIQTGINNNIKNHFLTRIRRLMNLLKPSEDIDSKLFNKIKNLILLNRHEKIPDEYRTWSLQIKQQYLPSEYEKCYGYDVKVHPEKYLYYLFKMNETIEEMNQKIENSVLSEEERRSQVKKLFQPFPLRNTIIPCYMTIDANTILSLFGKKGEKKLNKKTKENHNYIWGMLFNTDNKVMKKKGYILHSLQTDGIGVSLCFQKPGYHHLRRKDHKHVSETPYLDELSDQDLLICQQKKLVGGDPGKQSMIYFLNDHRQKLRYTTAQRRFESGRRRCQQITLKEKLDHQISEKESVLSTHNCKTMNYQKFKDYIHVKTQLNDQVKEFYQQELFRKMKWRTWIAKRTSEDDFLNQIEALYGSPEEVLICYGNWSQSRQMKHLLPSMGIGLRRLIGRKFPVVLVDEYCTSKLCCQCHHELQHYQNHYRVFMCPYCQSNCFASINHFFNRDVNACLNLLMLAHTWIQQKIRPIEYCRHTDPDLTLSD